MHTQFLCVTAAKSESLLTNIPPFLFPRKTKILSQFVYHFKTILFPGISCALFPYQDDHSRSLSGHFPSILMGLPLSRSFSGHFPLTPSHQPYLPEQGLLGHRETLQRCPPPPSPPPPAHIYVETIKSVFSSSSLSPFSLTCSSCSSSSLSTGSSVSSSLHNFVTLL